MKIFNSDKPILIIPYTHTLSHLSRPLEVAKKLRHKGYRNIFFAGDSPQISLIKAEGFDVMPLFEPDPVELYGNIRKGKMKFCDRATINFMVERELELYRECDPCLVLTDGRFTAPISCQIHCVKHAAIVNASSTEYRSIPYIQIWEWFSNLKFIPNAVSNLLTQSNLVLEMFVFDKIMNIFSELTKHYKLTKKVTATNCLTGVDLTLMADLPEYFPVKNPPNNYYYTGPITLKSNKTVPVPVWWPLKKNSHKKIVYLTMGSTGESELFKIIWEQLKSSDYITIITTGGKDTGAYPAENIYIEKFLDGDMVLSISDVVICHGGNGSIYQALSHGKPVIGIPTIPDQKFNMRRVEAFQVGKALSIDKIMNTPQIILRTIGELLNDNTAYQSNAKQFQKKLVECDGATKGANILAQYLMQKVLAPSVENGSCR